MFKKILYTVFPAAYGLLVYATVRILQDTESGFRFWRRPLVVNILEAGMSMLVGWLLVKCTRRLIFLNDKKKQGSSITSSSLLTEILTIVLICLVFVNCTFTPLAAMTDDGLSITDILYINIIPTLYSLIYYGYTRSSSFLAAYVHQQLLVSKLSNDRLETELKFLKAQYHPHFLFNALNTVYFQMEEDVPGARQSIEKLSALLRYQLYDQEKKVTMDRELEYLDNFIALQKLRASDLLQVSLEVDSSIRSQLVYPLLFLPLVENAFKYTGGEYQVHLAFLLEGNYITLVVENSLPLQPVAKKSGGIGLENLQRRLVLLYPGKHVFKLKTDEKKFRAIISIDIT